MFINSSLKIKLLSFVSIVVNSDSFKLYLANNLMKYNYLMIYIKNLQSIFFALLL
jgi:hypothetical protein